MWIPNGSGKPKNVKKRAAGKLLSWRVCKWLRLMCSRFRRKTLRHRGSPCARTCVLLHGSRLRVCQMIMMSGRQVWGANLLKFMYAVSPSSHCVQGEARKRDDVTGIVLPVAPSPLAPPSLVDYCFVSFMHRMQVLLPFKLTFPCRRHTHTHK